MANRFRGEASFEHEGKRIGLVVNMASLLRAEDETGEGMLALLSSPRVGFFGVLLRHAMIEAGEAEISREDAAELLMAAPEARPALRDAIDAAFPPDDASAEGKAPEPKRKAGTGTKS